MNPKIKVSQGRVRINAVYVVYATKDLLVIEADLHSKYPGDISIAWTWFGEEELTEEAEGPRVDIWTRKNEEGTEQTLYIDETTDLPATITLPLYVQDWTILTDARRYTVRIAAYNRRHSPRRIWRDE